jgi:hypothetical protein
MPMRAPPDNLLPDKRAGWAPARGPRPGVEDEDCGVPACPLSDVGTRVVNPALKTADYASERIACFPLDRRCQGEFSIQRSPYPQSPDPSG